MKAHNHSVASELEFDARKDTAHKFRPVDASKFAFTRDRETCAHCGESVGHKAHYSALGQFH